MTGAMIPKTVKKPSRGISGTAMATFMAPGLALDEPMRARAVVPLVRFLYLEAGLGAFLPFTLHLEASPCSV